MYVVVDEHAIFVIAVEFRRIDAVLRELHCPFHESQFGDFVVFGCVGYGKHTATYGARTSVAAVVAFAECRSVERRRAAAVYVDCVGCAGIGHHFGKLLGVYAVRQVIASVDNHHHDFRLVGIVADARTRV